MGGLASAAGFAAAAAGAALPACAWASAPFGKGGSEFMMLTGGMEAAEGKSQCSPGLTAAIGRTPMTGAAALATGAGDGTADMTGGFAAGGAFQPAT